MTKYLKIFLLVLAAMTASTRTTQAATEFLTSWRAGALVDSQYVGKVLPTRGSKVTIAFELLDNDKIADLSKNEVNWFREGAKFESGLGKKIATLTLPTLSNNESITLKISVRKYKGADIEKFITIPVAAPEVVIDSRHPLNKISSGLSTFKPLFYFWNANKVSNLNATWTSGNQESQELSGNNVLQLSIPAGAANTNMQLSVSAKNPKREFETAAATINLRIQ